MPSLPLEIRKGGMTTLTTKERRRKVFSFLSYLSYSPSGDGYRYPRVAVSASSDRIFMCCWQIARTQFREKENIQINKRGEKSSKLLLRNRFDRSFKCPPSSVFRGDGNENSKKIKEILLLKKVVKIFGVATSVSFA